MCRISSRIAILTLSIASAIHSADEALHITVGPNILVSKSHPELFHAEIWFAADPNHSNRLMGGSMAYVVTKDIHRSIAYVSLDAGKSWKATLETGESTDPACAYGPDGTTYWVHLNRQPRGEMEIYRSKDGGQTWLPPVIQRYLDREWLTVDNTQGKHRGRIYISAHQAGDADRRTRVLTLAHSDDGGTHFSETVTSAAPPKGFATPGNNIVLPDGALAIVFVNLSNPAQKPKPAERLRQLRGSIGVAFSDDGDRLCEERKVSDWFYPESANNLAYIPVISVDRTNGRFRGRMYVTWVDTRSGRAGIYLSWSGDRGKTWSAPLPVTDDVPRAGGGGPNHLHPAVAVNKDGIVGVSWYDRRETVDDRGWRERFIASRDGGVTFSPGISVSEALYDPARNQPATVNESVERTVRNTGAKITIPRWHFVFNGGDTASMVADADGLFHAFWTDNRTGTVQLWTSSIKVE